MDRSDTITLISAEYETDQSGVQRCKQETAREVFCNVSSIGWKEWLECGRSGLKPEYRFTIFEGDYQNETVCEYRGERYAIFRLYRGKNEMLELYVQRKEGVQA